MSTQTTFRSLTISAGNGKRIMSQDGRYRRQYTVSVKSDGTGVTRRFTFTDSIHNEENGKVGLSSEELLYAFRCFTEDATAAMQPFEDFADDFGYDNDSIRARNVYLACKASLRKFRDLWATDVDPYEVLEQLGEW